MSRGTRFLAMSERVHFTLKFDGEAFEDHTIEISDLAPALIALQELVETANAQINNGRTRVSLKVKATSEGSFGIDIQAFESLIDQTVDFFSGKHVVALGGVVLVLGLMKNGGVGLLELLRRLQGKKPKAIKEIGDDLVEITLPDGTTIRSAKKTIEIYQSVPVRKAAYRFVKPLEREGIDKIEVIKEDQVVAQVNKEDLPGFFVPQDDSEPLESVRETVLRIKALWFDGGHKWRFSEGGQTFAAVIKDEKFLEQIMVQDQAVHASDLLRVNLKQTQIKTEQGFKLVYEILEVKEHIRGARQTALL